MTDWPRAHGDMARRIRLHDWAATPLGPIEQWPAALKTVVDLMLASGHAMQVAWGPERIVLYNDPYAPMLGERHPAALGIPFRDAWPDVWDEIEPLVTQVFAGETVRFEDMPLVMTRHGYPEQTWWRFAYSPIWDDTGAIAGLLNVTFENTAQHRAERERDAALADLQRNEARFRALGTAGVDITYRMSPDWRVMHQLGSDTLAQTTAPIEDWVPKYIPASDLPTVQAAIDTAIRTRSLFEHEHRVRRADGSLGWVLSRAVPLLGPDCEIVEWFGTASDVTARRDAVERLHDSEQKYRALFDNMDQGYVLGDVIFDAEGHAVDIAYVESNAAAVRMVGLDLVGKRLSQLGAGYEPYWLEIWGRVATSGQGERLQRFASPLKRWYDFYVFKPQPEQHDSRRVAVLFQDVTERRREERRQAFLLQLADALRPLAEPAAIEGQAARLLREEADVGWCFYIEYDDALQTAIVLEDAAREGLPSLAGRHDITDIPGYVALLSSGQLIDVPDFAHCALFSPRVVQQYTAIGVHAMLGVPLVKEGRLVAQLTLHDTRPRQWTDDEKALLRDVAERTWAAVERARAEQSLAHELEKQKLAERRKDEFLAVLSHELRNPLAPIAMGLELIERSRRQPELLDRALPMMHRQLAHITHLVNDLLDLSRVSRGRIELRHAPLDLNHAAEAAIEQAQGLLKSRRHDFTATLSGEPLPVMGDIERLTQAIANLLTNAAKYTPPAAEVTLTTEMHDGQALVRVRDTGYGIPAERLQEIFEMFVQVPEHRQRDAGSGGLGIGLALVRQLVALHGGSIEAASEGLGHGSEFTIRLPLAPRQVHATPAATPLPAPRLSRRVLVVDDNVDAAESLRRVLSFEGHEVETAHDGPGAMQRLAAFDADIVLLDIGLPGFDGLEVARRARRMPGRERLPLVALSGWGQDDDRRRAEEAGFDHHLTKPVGAAEVLGLIQKLAGERRGAG